MGGTENKFDANSQSEEFVADPAASGLAGAPDEQPSASASDEAALQSEPTDSPVDPAESEAARREDAPERELAPQDSAPAQAATEPAGAHQEPSLAEEAEARQGPVPDPAVPPHEPPPPGAPDLILDERLTSAAAPFLYLLAIVLLAVAGYLIYSFL
ncbi:hypothetical protein JDN40_09795 [Rhodomicrobium vannielii ATCC 17100]|uniref:hypothetical protein n=1 Tax=Rhodomicrobium vannielii TaxID=1069 RepID=UPI001919E62A|nr:hypothetical protein [Rhodomicrobium vannielii]MBJ7534394.1 hypothetical protein [Rhodomicrobium vannielii ATCC 17100]